MAREQVTVVLRHLHTLVDGPGGEEFSDGQLLRRFAAKREEVVFQAIVRRHGPLVLSVCRRLLHDPRDVEDAFQATFLILARKAASIRKQNSVGSWLYGVAYRVAARARKTLARRRTHERGETDMLPAASHPNPDGPNPTAGHAASLDQLAADDAGRTDPAEVAFRRETRRALDEELCRLPEKYRAPLILCYLEGQSTAEAAQHLGWPAGTLKSRLGRARELLRSRLTRRGIVLSASALTLELSRAAATAAVPAALIEGTTRAALLFAAGNAVAGGGISTEAAALATGVLKAMTLTKVKLTVFAALFVGLLGLSAGPLLHSLLVAQTPTADKADRDRAPEAPAEKAALKDH
jgi:RNA polymerase sigma factor (sigma-70 family)